jgi:hypothetical protein
VVVRSAVAARLRLLAEVEDERVRLQGWRYEPGTVWWMVPRSEAEMGRTEVSSEDTGVGISSLLLLLLPPVFWGGSGEAMAKPDAWRVEVAVVSFENPGVS